MAQSLKEKSDAIIATLTPEQQQSMLATLQEAPGLFRYTVSDRISDTWHGNPALQGSLIRTGGVLQAVGGLVGGAAASGLIATGGGTCVGTGVGCMAAAGGVGLGFWSADQIAAGVGTAVKGSQQPTAVGGVILPRLTGWSAETTELGYGLVGLSPLAWEAYALNRLVNAQAAANAWTRGTYTGSSAIQYEGRVYRFSDPAYADKAWDIHPGNIMADYRYSGPGVGSIYSGTTVETASAEVLSYRNWNVAMQPKVLVAGDVRIAGTLDLTDPAALRALGVTRDQIVMSSHGANGAYNHTQRIAEWAREQGYNAILAPSAQARSGTNLITFDSTKVTNVRFTWPAPSPPMR